MGDGLIGVHCTHGVNRTGFLICKYMIAKLGFKPQDAIKAFGDARGHHIERAAYIQSLGIKACLAEALAGEEPKEIILEGVNTGSRYRRDRSPHRQHRGRFHRPRPPPCGFSQGYPPRAWRGPNSWQNTPYQSSYSNRGHYNSSYDRPRGAYNDFQGSYNDHWGPPRGRHPMDHSSRGQNRDRNERWVRDVHKNGAGPSRNWADDDDISPPGVDKD
ncbi:hypothetical protein B566_EDAN004226 [Ephemera danica]|nr:hypothetical protein B566_EDAN004226 [Ephemera danica]